MENELQLAFISILNSAVEAKDFLVSEIPEVAKQALLYYGVQSFIYSSTAIIIAAICYKFTSSVLSHKYEWTKSYSGSLSDEGFFALVIADALGLILFMILFDLAWLKIWLAPKLWLMEYASALIK